MKKLILISIMIAISLTGCKTNEEDDNQSTNPVEITPITEIRLNGGGNFLFKDTSQSLSSNISNLSTNFISQSTSSSTGTISTMYTFSEEDLNSLLEVVVIGGVGKTQTAAWEIVNSTNFVAGIKSVDVSGDVTTCFVRPNNLCVELQIDPDPLYNLNGSPHFFELDTTDDINPIFYRDGQIIHALYIDASGDSTDDVFISANQLAINVNGDMMLEDTSGIVKYRKADGSLWSTDNDYWDEYSGNYINVKGSINKFFLPSNNGFLIKCGYGSKLCFPNSFSRFFRDALTDDVIVRLSYENSYYDYIFYGYPLTYFTEFSYANKCYNYNITGIESLTCVTTLGGLPLINIYNIGDVSSDLLRLNFNFSTHLRYGLREIMTSKFVYMSSNYSDGSPKKLSRINYHGTDPSDDTPLLYGYNIEILSGTTDESSDTDKLRFCGTEYSSGLSVVGEINNADSSPDISTIYSTCDNLIHL